MLKKKKTAFISLILGGVILTGAAAANFATSNGYNIYKESARKLFDQTNYTMNLKVAASIDGEELVSEEIIEQYDKDGKGYVFKNISRDSTDEEYPERRHERYYQDGIYIYHSSPSYKKNGVYSPDDSYHVSDMTKSHMIAATFDKSNWGYGEDEMFDKYFNFGMTCLDALVGDIKNNFVLTEAQNGLSTYEATLDLFQIPEIVNSGADLLASQLQNEMERSNSEDEMEEQIAKLVFDPFVNSAKCIFTVDDVGRLIDTVISAEISGKDEGGESHTLDVSMQLSFSDYGTTTPEKIDLDGDNIVLESEEQRTRIAELEVLLEDDNLSDEQRNDYEREYNSAKARLDYFDEYGPIDYEEVRFITNEDGEVETRLVERDDDGNEVIAQKVEAPEVTVEEIELNPNSADGASSVAVIGGADSPTEVYVAK